MSGETTATFTSARVEGPVPRRLGVVVSVQLQTTVVVNGTTSITNNLRVIMSSPSVSQRGDLQNWRVWLSKIVVSASSVVRTRSRFCAKFAKKENGADTMRRAAPVTRTNPVLELTSYFSPKPDLHRLPNDRTFCYCTFQSVARLPPPFAPQVSPTTQYSSLISQACPWSLPLGTPRLFIPPALVQMNAACRKRPCRRT